MNIMVRTLTLIFVLAFCNISSARAGFPSAGLEFEFASVGMMDPKWGKAHEAMARALLREVKKLNGDSGAIAIQVWPKNPNLTEVIYTDGTGRKWAVTPESLNTTGYDGLEFVTPPLEGDADLELLDRVLAKFKESKSVMRGIRSSMHITVDVRHLVMGQDFDKVVERILFIENSWADIYRTVRPRRYGAIVNRFAVPLASDQQELLQKLGEMPKSERTYDNVRNLFMRYDAVEGSLRDPDRTRGIRKWKYRAGNYSKLFALQGAEPAPVIEFRVSDMDYGIHVQEKVKYFRDLVTREIPRQKFEFPFGTNALTPPQANLAVKDMLGIDDPALQNIELHDLDTPLELKGKNVSMGFEAEFRSDTNPFENAPGRINKQSYPFLDGNVSLEASGNTEIRSIGGEWRLGEVMEEMRLVKRKLNGALRGFHFHIFIPKEGVPPELEDRMKGWFAYIGDTMVGWRLQNRKHFFALKTWSVGRVNPSDFSRRASLRIQKHEDFLDLELRGFMDSDYDIETTVQKLLTGLKNPELIPPAMENYTKHFQAEMPVDQFEKDLDQFAQTFHNRRLSAEERKAIRELVKGDWFKNVLPVYRLQNSQVFDEFQRRTLRDAHQNFLKETMTVIKNQIAGKYDLQPKDLEKNFRFRVKRWAESIDFYSLMQSNMLLSPESKIGRIVKVDGTDIDTMVKKVVSRSLEFEEALARVAAEDRSAFTRRILQTEMRHYAYHYYVNGGRIPDEEVCAALRASFPTEPVFNQTEILWVLELNPIAENVNFVQGLMEARFSPNAAYYEAAIKFLGPYEDARTVAIFKKLSSPAWEKVRSVWAAELRKRTDEATFAVIKSAVNSSDTKLKMAGLSALVGRDGPGVVNLLRPLLNSGDVDVTFSAISALANKSDPQALTILNRYLNGADATFRRAALHALGNSTAPGAVDAIMALILADPGDRRYPQLIAGSPSKEWATKALQYYRKGGLPQSIVDELVSKMETSYDSESLAILEELASDPNGVYTRTAIFSLSRRPEERAKTVLLRLARDPRICERCTEVMNPIIAAEAMPLGEEVPATVPFPPRTVEEYIRQNGTLRNIPCNLLLR